MPRTIKITSNATIEQTFEIFDRCWLSDAEIQTALEEKKIVIEENGMQIPHLNGERIGTVVKQNTNYNSFKVIQTTDQ